MIWHTTNMLPLSTLIRKMLVVHLWTGSTDTKPQIISIFKKTYNPKNEIYPFPNIDLSGFAKIPRTSCHYKK